MALHKQSCQIYSEDTLDELESLYEIFGLGSEDPPKEFYKVTSDTLNDVTKDLDSRPAAVTIYNKDKPKLSDYKTYTSTVSRAKKEAAKHKGNKKKFMINYAQMKGSYKIAEQYANELYAIYKKHGFKPYIASKDNGAIRNLVNYDKLYYQIDDNWLILASTVISYTTYYGLFVAFGLLELEFKAVKITDKVRETYKLPAKKK